MDGSQSQRYLRDAKAKMRAEEAQFAQRLRQGRKHQLSVAAARISQMNGWAEQLKDDRRFDLKVESSGSDSDDSDSGRTHRAIESSTGYRPILAIGAQRAHVIIKAPDRHPIKIKLGPQFDKEYMAMRDAISKLEQRKRASGGSKSSYPGGVILIDGLRLPRSASKQDDSDIPGETAPGLGPGSHGHGHGQSSGDASSRSPGRAGDGTGAAGSNAAQGAGGGAQLGKQGTLRQMRHVLREVATLTQVLREQASVLRSRGWNGASRGDLQVQRQLPWRPPSSGHVEGKAAGDAGEGGSRASGTVGGAVGGAWSGSDGDGVGTGEGGPPVGSRIGGGAGGTPWMGGGRVLGHFPAEGAAHGSAEGGRSVAASEAGSQVKSLRSKASAAHGGAAGGPPAGGKPQRLLVEAGHEIGSHPDPLPQEVARGAGLRSDGEVTAAVGGYRATPELLGQIRSTLRSAAEQSRDGEL